MLVRAILREIRDLVKISILKVKLYIVKAQMFHKTFWYKITMPNESYVQGLQ